MTDKQPKISFRLIARNAAETLDFYEKGLGADEVMRWVAPDSGKTGHLEVRIGDIVFYLADEYPSMQDIGVDSPALLGGTTLTVWLRVDDLEAALNRALKAGAKLLEPIEVMTVQDGRRCRIADPAGHVWTL